MIIGRHIGNTVVTDYQQRCSISSSSIETKLSWNPRILDFQWIVERTIKPHVERIALIVVLETRHGRLPCRANAIERGTSAAIGKLKPRTLSNLSLRLKRQGRVALLLFYCRAVARLTGFPCFPNRLQSTVAGC